MVIRRKLSYLSLSCLLGVFAGAGSAAEISSKPQNLLGEACSVVARDDVVNEPGLPSMVRLHCADHPVGERVAFRMPRLQGEDGWTQASMQAQYRRSPLWASHQARFQCSSPTVMHSSAQHGVLALPCFTKQGANPVAVLLQFSATSLVSVEAAPVALPAMVSLLDDHLQAVLPAVSKEYLNTLFKRPMSLLSSRVSGDIRQALKAARAAENLTKYAEAETFFRQALALQTRYLPEQDPAVTDTLLDLAFNLSNQDRFDEADALFRRAEPAIQRSLLDSDRARWNTYQGYHAANQGQFSTARPYARTAVEAWRKMASGDALQSLLQESHQKRPSNALEQAELAMALNFEASMALRLDDTASASALAGEALTILSRLQQVPIWWRANVLLTMGQISATQGRISAAEQYFNAALAIRRRAFGEGPATLAVLMELGRAYQSEGLLTSSLITYRDAFRLAQQLPVGSYAIRAEQLLPFVSAVVQYAGRLEREEERQGLFAEAFAAFQFLKSSAVDKTIVNAQKRLLTQHSALQAAMDQLQSVERERDQARMELATEQALPDDERSAEVETRLQRVVRETERQVHALTVELYQRFPDYAQLSAPQPLSLMELRQRLGDREAVVSFLIGRQQSFVQVIRRQGSWIAALPDGEQALQDQVKALRRAVDIQGGSLNEFDLQRAHQLYQHLLGPLQVALQDVDHLIVAANGPLASLPFGVLVMEPAPERDYVNAKWLATRYAISHVPSLPAFYSLRSTLVAKVPAKSLLAFGNPVLHGAKAASSVNHTECRPAGPMQAERLLAMDPLPDTQQEITAIRTMFGVQQSDVFFKQDATEESFRRQSLDNYRVIYFATHGLLPGELKCQAEPGLVLTPPAKTAEVKHADGLLEASEISTMKVNADLVVLSACNTAAGSARGGGRLAGESLSGLAEAFFFAGARGLMVSHWQVPSAATTQLMTGAFRTLGPDLKGGASPALRQAQLALIQQPKTAHPFFWGAFVVVGDGYASSASEPLASQVSVKTAEVQ